MRIAAISDIHCNAEALEQALDALAGEVDEVFCAGDVVYEYRFSPEVVGRLRHEGFPFVLGNHEHVLLSPAGQAARNRAAEAGADPDDFAYLAALPYRIDGELGGRKVTMVHASPWEPYDRYLTASDPTWKRSAELGADVVLTGHTHVPMVKRVGDTLVVNPGSLGESREPGQRDAVTYALIDLVDLDAEIVRFPNPRF